MAWQGEVNKNIEESWAASVMFYVKKALMDANWSLLSYGNGLPVFRDGKGGTSGPRPTSDGQPGKENTGSGGGGGVNANLESQRRLSGSGADGVVIIRYLSSSSITASGGVESEFSRNGLVYKLHVFNESGVFEVSSGSGDVEYLIVGGGGGGGHRGGGNGGEVLQGTFNVSIDEYSVVVGNGGEGLGLSIVSAPGNPGDSSSVFGLTAAGGAGGVSGGSASTVTPGVGAGGSGTGTIGGPGLLSEIQGFGIYYGAGGGGGEFISNTNPDNFGGLQGFGGFVSPNFDDSPVPDVMQTIESFDEPGAWFRVREPAIINSEDPRREFVFQKGVAGNGLLIKYSRASGFSEGGSAEDSPTTGSEGDGVVVSSTTGTDADSTSSSSAAVFNVAVNSSNRINVVVSSVPVFGVFPFYIWSYRNGTGECDSIVLHEAVLPGTTSELDQDPTYRVVASGGVALKFLDVDAGTIGDYWEAYGLSNAVHRRGNLGFASGWGTNAAPTGSSTPRTQANTTRVFPPINVLGFSPYTNTVVSVPTLVGIGGQFPKGFSSGVSFSGFTNQNVLDTFNLTTISPRIIAHYPNAREAIFLPWVSNVVPQV